CFCRILIDLSIPLIITTLTFFFFNITPTTEIYTLSLHDALPIFAALACGLAREYRIAPGETVAIIGNPCPEWTIADLATVHSGRSEEHTSELQSRFDLVCRLLLEKKKHKNSTNHSVNQS